MKKDFDSTQLCGSTSATQLVASFLFSQIRPVQNGWLVKMKVREYPDIFRLIPFRDFWVGL